MAVCFVVNWLVDFGITRATPNMIREMHWGIFMLYAMLTYLGVAFIFFCFPELRGRSLESMDDLFQRPLWLMWRHAYPTEEEKVRHGIREQVEGGNKLQVQETRDTEKAQPEEKSNEAVYVENAS
jgi:hypothetical protein